MTVSQTALIVTSNEQKFTFWNREGTKKMIELYSNIEKNRIEVGVLGEPLEQLDKLKSTYNPYKSYFDRYGNNPFQKDAGFVLGLVFKNKKNYILTVTVGCRMKTWNFPLRLLSDRNKQGSGDIFKLSVSGVESLTKASVQY